MSLWHVIILAIVQGMAELLPVSSSAHVIVAEKLMGMDPTAPALTLLLVMLHTGTMFAVIVYFWKQWRRAYFRNMETFKITAIQVIAATIATGVVGLILKKVVEKLAFPNAPHAQIEQLFGRLDLIAPALAAVGILILVAGLREAREPVASSRRQADEATGLDIKQAGWMGAVQGLCLPFRGFSRSGATISTAMLMGVAKSRAEAFSFALAVVLTPPVIAREVWRLAKLQHITGAEKLASAVGPSLLGAFFAFLAGLLALKWLSRWLETGRWWWFGVYCLIAAAVVGYLHHIGY